MIINRKELNLKHPVKMYVKLPGLSHQMLAALHKAVDSQKEAGSDEYFGEDKNFAKIEITDLRSDANYFPIVQIASSRMDKEYPGRYVVELIVTLVAPFAVERGGSIKSRHLFFPSFARLQELFQSIGLLPDVDEFIRR